MKLPKKGYYPVGVRNVHKCVARVHNQSSFVKNSFSSFRNSCPDEERPILCVEYSSLPVARRAEWRNPQGGYLYK